jgi:hypothetical protein
MRRGADRQVKVALIRLKVRDDGFMRGLEGLEVDAAIEALGKRLAHTQYDIVFIIS